MLIQWIIIVLYTKNNTIELWTACCTRIQNTNAIKKRTEDDSGLLPGGNHNKVTVLDANDQLLMPTGSEDTVSGKLQENNGEFN